MDDTKLTSGGCGACVALGFRAVFQRAIRFLQHDRALYCALRYGQAVEIASCVFSVIAMYAPEKCTIRAQRGR